MLATKHIIKPAEDKNTKAGVGEKMKVLKIKRQTIIIKKMYI